MGRLSLGNKSSSTSDQAIPPRVSCGSRQSQETNNRTKIAQPTTETTTRFPPWRKGSNTTASNLQRPRTAVDVPGSGAWAPSFQRDKALPPTPSDSPTYLTPSPDTSEHNRQTTTANRKGEALQSHSTLLLAQTSLGLGLSHHVLPPALPSSAPRGSDVNTIAFISSSPSTENLTTFRRSQSSQRLDEVSNSAQDQMGKRIRGISLGPTPFLNFISSGEKREEKVVDPPKALTRKPSFWSRRKVQSPNPTQTRPATAHTDISQQHPLQEISISDFQPTPPQRQKLQARGPLSHFPSERPQSYHPVTSLDVSVSPITTVPSSTRRPSTAGSPITAKHGPSTSHLTPGSSRAATVSFSELSTNTKVPTPRARSQTNPPLLHRLSLNIFSSSTFLSASPTSSPVSPSLSPAPDVFPNLPITPHPLENDESPDIYVKRLLVAVSKVEVTSILASSTKPFYVAALKAFIGRFDFSGHPLDIALRQLLLEIGLPKETQQIDRVMEAFAQRYVCNNPDLYVSEDHPYILAFSLIMLHTDAFNKSNRHKMTKADYIKNTTLPSVAPEILEYFYDNVVFAPFIFIEDPLDSQRVFVSKSNRRSTIFRDLPATNPSHPATGPTLAMKINKIDPYFMISNGLLGPLRIDIERIIPLSDPFSYQGPAGKWDEEALLLAFANAQVLEVKADAGRTSTFFGLASGGSSSPLVTINSPFPDVACEELSTLRVTKIGLLNRKDESYEGGKKPLSRKWKPWAILLTGSQLLFSRDPTWMQAMSSQCEKDEFQILMSSSTVLKVDESLSVKNAVAVHDKSYTKHRFTFRLALPEGRHVLLKASSENEMNQWIAQINYASAFKTAGVRMRLLGMSGRSMRLTGVAAATSHLHDLQNQIHSPSSDSTMWDENAPQELFEMLSGDGPLHKRPHFEGKVTLRTSREEVELEAATPLEVEKTAEFKDAFEQVKADLAAESWTQIGKGSQPAISLSTTFPRTPKGGLSPQTASSDEVYSQPTRTSSNDRPRLLSRSQTIEAKIADLNGRLIATEAELDTHMRFLRNVATLTPFQKTTRDRLIAAVQTRARTVMQLRLDIVRVRCHRNVLREDLDAENRIWKKVKDTALKAAKETLRSRQQSPEIPQMAFSMRKHPQNILSGPLQVQKCPNSESSFSESFHTAIDFGTDWPSSDDLGSSFLAASQVFDSPRPSTSGSLSSFPINGNSSRIWKSEPEFAVGSQVDHDITPKGEEAESGTQHEKFSTAQECQIEEAEAWDKTRCAKRVSLVRVPSALDLLPVSKRLTLTLSKTTEPQGS